MAKVTKSESKKSILQKQESGLVKFHLNDVLSPSIQVWIGVAFIFAVFAAYLSPLLFGGKTFVSGDIQTFNSYVTFLAQDRDDLPLWNPYIFGGMPSYSISVGHIWFNFIYVAFTAIRDVYSMPFEQEYVKWTFYIILLAINSFFLIRYLTKNTLISLFGGLSTGLSTGIMLFLFIGHVTKLTSIAWFPLVLLVLFRMQDKVRAFDFFALVVIVQLMIQGFHVQVIFYLVLAITLYYLFFFVRELITKDKVKLFGLFKSAGAFAAAIVLAVLIQSDSLTQVYEYTPYSTRGQQSLVEKSGTAEDESSIQYYDYHTQWSFSIGEIATFVVPSYYGFGHSTYQGDLTEGKAVPINTYFGQMEFVDLPMYMGVLVFFLGLYGVWAGRKNPLVQYLGLVTLFALLLSFGKNFALVFDPMFHLFPYFNKFRVPSMALILVQLMFPILASLGLFSVYEQWKNKDTRDLSVLKILAYISGGLFVAVLLFNSVISDSAGERFLGSQIGQQLGVLKDYVGQMVATDFVIAFFLTAVAFWGMYLALSRKISPEIVFAVILLLGVVDLWRINTRGATYEEASAIQTKQEKPIHISVIQGLKDTQPYRIINLKQDRSPGSISNNANFNMFYLQEDFLGYSGVKPRAIQDIYDIVGAAGNPATWRMLNVKYIVTDQRYNIPGTEEIFADTSTIVYRNNNALPRAYLVNQVKKADALTAVTAAKADDYDAATLSYVHDRDLNLAQPSVGDTSTIIGYDEHYIKVKTKTAGSRLLFIGNTFTKGWKATVSGKEAEIIKTNHGFLGVVVPAGENIVEVVFAPTSYYITKTVVMVTSALVLLGLLITFIMQYFMGKKKEEQTV